MKKIQIEKEDIINLNVYFNWGKEGFGFGQLSFHQVDGKIKCMNECMSRETVRELMHAFVDTVVDNAEMDCE